MIGILNVDDDITGDIIDDMDNQEQYEKDLAERKRRHLEAVRQGSQRPWQPCMHDQCTQCHGTGVKLDGSTCVHFMSCPCPKCSPTYMGTLPLETPVRWSNPPVHITTTRPWDGDFTAFFDSATLTPTVLSQAPKIFRSRSRNPEQRFSLSRDLGFG